MKKNTLSLAAYLTTLFGCSTFYDSGPQLLQENGNWRRYYRVTNEQESFSLSIKFEELNGATLKERKLIYTENDDGSCKSITIYHQDFWSAGYYEKSFHIDNGCDGNLDMIRYESPIGNSEQNRSEDNDNYVDTKTWEEWNEEYLKERDAFDNRFNLIVQIDRWHQRRKNQIPDDWPI